jgi:hypothetical protein
MGLAQYTHGTEHRCMGFAETSGASPPAAWAKEETIVRSRNNRSDIPLLAIIPVAAAAIFFFAYVGGWKYELPSWVPTFDVSFQPVTDRVRTVVNENKTAAAFLIAGMIAGLILMTWLAMVLLDLMDTFKRFYRWAMHRESTVSGLLRPDATEAWSASAARDTSQSIYHSRTSDHIHDLPD